MKRSIVDSSIWISIFVDKNEIGKEFSKWYEIQEGETSQIIITYGVMTEVIAMVLKKKGFKKAKRVLDMFLDSEKVQIYNKSLEFYEDIINVFNRYEVLSLVDAEIVLIYHLLKCNQLVSTDSGFNHCEGIDVYRIPQ